MDRKNGFSNTFHKKTEDKTPEKDQLSLFTESSEQPIPVPGEEKQHSLPQNNWERNKLQNVKRQEAESLCSIPFECDEQNILKGVGKMFETYNNKTVFPFLFPVFEIRKI